MPYDGSYSGQPAAGRDPQDGVDRRPVMVGAPP